VCAPKGRIVFFEHNPYNLFTQWVIKTTPLDHNAHLVTYQQLTRSARAAGINILDKEFFLYGTRKIDETFERLFPG
jgi:hypothetical protein